MIGDDELDLGVFELSSDEPGEMRRALPGELPEDASERKQDKPDLEALTMLPPFEGAPYGALLGLGSGSKRAAATAASSGSSTRAGRWSARRRRSTCIRSTSGCATSSSELNVEGAAVLGERFFVFHRGNADERENAIAELSLEQVMDSLTGDHSIDVAELRADPRL